MLELEGSKDHVGLRNSCFISLILIQFVTLDCYSNTWNFFSNGTGGRARPNVTCIREFKCGPKVSWILNSFLVRMEFKEQTVIVSLKCWLSKEVRSFFLPFIFYQSYSVFHRFRHAKFANGGSILSSSQFSILPKLPQKMKFATKVVKIDPKIIISLPKI